MAYFQQTVASSDAVAVGAVCSHCSANVAEVAGAVHTTDAAAGAVTDTEANFADSSGADATAGSAGAGNVEVAAATSDAAGVPGAVGAAGAAGAVDAAVPGKGVCRCTQLNHALNQHAAAALSLPQAQRHINRHIHKLPLHFLCAFSHPHLGHKLKIARTFAASEIASLSCSPLPRL